MTIKNKFRKTIGTVVLLAGACILTQGISREFFPEKIKNTEDLIRIVKEEECSIRRDNIQRKIYWIYGRSQWGTIDSARIGEGKYLVRIDKKRDRTAIRHELYHIYAGHCDRAVEKGDWSGWDQARDELTAMMYADFGLKL